MAGRTTKPITLVFIDDSGDPGFRPDGKASEFFVVGMVIFQDPLEAEKAAVAFKQLRRDLGFDDRFEFKFNNSKPETRTAFLSEAAKHDFRIRSLIVDKKRVRPEQLPGGKNSLYAFFIMRALKDLAGSIRESKVRIDGVNDRVFRRAFASYLRRELGGTGAERIVGEVRFEDSHRNILIQLADMATGSIYRAHTQGDDTYRKIIMVKIDEEKKFT